MMKETTFKLLFYLKRATVSKKGKCPIMARLSIGRTMVQFSCKTVCSPNLWDSRKNRLIGKSAEAVGTNHILDTLHLNILHTYQELSKKSSSSVTAEDVRDALLGINKAMQGILFYADRQIEHFKSRVGIDRSERRLKCMMQFRKHLGNFIGHHYHLSELPLRKADVVFVENFHLYLRDTLGFKTNTIAGYLTFLFSLLKELHKEKEIERNPFVNYSIRWEVGTPRHLTREELQRIEEIDLTTLNDYERVSRDMFLFACYTGLSYGDVRSLTKEHIKEENGIRWICKPRIKTKHLCHIPLLSEALKIIDIYEGIHSKAFRNEPPEGYLLPIPGCATINIHLKKIARLCNIDKNLTFHMARHTFACQMTLSEGVSMETVSKMLGHSQITTTQIYAETFPERIFRDMDSIMPVLQSYTLTN